MSEVHVYTAPDVLREPIEWKNFGGTYYVRCWECKLFRATSGENFSRLKHGKRNNICVLCSRKNVAKKLNVKERKKQDRRKADQKVQYTCENCGETRSIRTSTLWTYRSRGEQVWCQKCKGEKLCSSSIISRPIYGPMPMIEGPSREGRGACYVCHGSYFRGHECHRYDKCLDWAVATGMQSFVCAIPGAAHVVEVVESAGLYEAYLQSVHHGFVPEQTQRLALR